jgi:hypothetical protein
LNKLMAQIELGMRSEMGNLEEFSKDLSFKIRVLEFRAIRRKKKADSKESEQKKIARISVQIPSNYFLGNWKDLRREGIGEEKWEDCYKFLK